MRKLDGNFPGGCCIPLGEREGALLCRPDTPEPVTGNQWFRFIARLTGDPGRRRIELHWPPDDEELKARLEYGQTANFVTAIHRAIHQSADAQTWEPVEPVDVEGQIVRFTVDLRSQELYIAVGIPYLPADLERLMAEMAVSPHARVEQIATTAHGRAVRAIRIGPADGGQGSFYLQGMQHQSEWAGGRILSALARYLVSDAGAALRERYVFHLVPVVNVDGLYTWRQSPPGNMNRDWEAFQMRETAGVRDYIRRFLARGERLLYVLDLHMGWSNVENSGGCLTAAPDGMAPPEIIEKQIRLAEHVFARTDWTDRIWRASHRNGTTCAFWALREFGIPAQTGENSRHMVLERASGRWVRTTQAHEERRGRDLAEALASFDW